MDNRPFKAARKIDEAKDLASGEVTGNTGEMEDAVNETVVNSMESNFDFKNGIIVVTKNFTKQLDKFVNDILSGLKLQPRYAGNVAAVVKRIPEVKAAIDKFQKDQGVTVPNYDLANGIVSYEFREQMLRHGLNSHFLQPLRDLMFRDALTGLSLKDAKKLIDNYVRSGKDKSGKLKSYAEQTAMQAVDAYSGMISMKLMEDFSYDALLITGSLIDTSSPQCRYAIEELGGTIRRSDWPDLKKIAEKHGLIKGTTFDNLPVNQLHWGCRHSFYPIKLKKSAA